MWHAHATHRNSQGLVVFVRVLRLDKVWHWRSGSIGASCTRSDPSVSSTWQSISCRCWQFIVNHWNVVSPPSSSTPHSVCSLCLFHAFDPLEKRRTRMSIGRQPSRTTARARLRVFYFLSKSSVRCSPWQKARSCVSRSISIEIL